MRSLILLALLSAACGPPPFEPPTSSNHVDSIQQPFLTGDIGDRTFDGAAEVLTQSRISGDAMDSIKVIQINGDNRGFILMHFEVGFDSFTEGAHTFSHPPDLTDTDAAVVLVCSGPISSPATDYDQQANHVSMLVNRTEAGLHFEVQTTTNDYTDPNNEADTVQVMFDVAVE